MLYQDEIMNELEDKIEKLRILAENLLNMYKTATYNHPDDPIRQIIIEESERILYSIE